jgi:hypothetical protein
MRGFRGGAGYPAAVVRSVTMPSYYEFEVSLQGVKPKTWRRFQLRTDASFLDLHYAIQLACGWENAHLFAFRTLKRRPIAGGSGDGWIEGYPDAGKIRVAAVPVRVRLW